LENPIEQIIDQLVSNPVNGMAVCDKGEQDAC
jgi:hypothetical protein